MASEIKLFSSPKFGDVRTVISDGKLMFIASDVAKALGYAVPQKAVITHCKHCSKMEHPTNRGTIINIIPESDLYRLTMKSQLPDASAFQDWVCEDVLPSIRKSGGYLSVKADDTPEEIMARALTIAQATLAKREERLKQLEADNAMKDETIEAQATELRQAAPKVQYVDNVLQSVNTYTATQIAKEVGMDAAKFHRVLKERKVMFYQSGTWMLTARYQGQGYTKMRTHQFTRNDGSIGTSSYTVFTERGRALMHSIFAK